MPQRGLTSQHADSAGFAVEVDRSGGCSSVTLSESNVFGRTAITFTPQEAKEVALFLLKAVAALEFEDDDLSRPVHLVAAAAE